MKRSTLTFMLAMSSVFLLICLGVLIFHFSETQESLLFSGGQNIHINSKDKKNAAKIVVRSIEIKVGQKIDPKDAVISAVDDKGNDISDKVVALETVDTSKPGTYYIVYLAPYGKNEYVTATGPLVVTE